MAIELRGQTFPGLVAHADYSSAQHRFVFVNASGNAELSANGGQVDGVLENDPKAGQAAAVHAHGIAKVQASAAIAVGAKVSSAASGKAKTAVSGDQIVGTCVVAAGALDEFCSVLMGASEGGFLA